MDEKELTDEFYKIIDEGTNYLDSGSVPADQGKETVTLPVSSYGSWGDMEGKPILAMSNDAR